MAICAFIGLLVLAFWIWMLIDAIQNKGLTDGEKIGWVLAIVFLHIIGSVALFFHPGRPKRNATLVAGLNLRFLDKLEWRLEIAPVLREGVCASL